jgi:EmrB/QacA subfamily drug resistance transporter
MTTESLVHEPIVRAPAVELSSTRKRLVLAVLVFTILMIWLDNTVLNVALKTLADPVKGLGANISELQWAISSYTLVFAALLFTGGVIADRYGRRLMLASGMLIFAAASVWAAYASSAAGLITARAVMGLGSALVTPATLSIITWVFNERERPAAIAVWSGSAGLAIAAGPLLGGALLERFWWGSIFLINVPVTLVALLAAFALIPESRDPVRRRFDPIGLLLSVAGLCSLVFGIIRGGQIDAWDRFEVLGPIAAGIVLLAAFVLVELRVVEPSFDMRLFRNPRFAGASFGLMFSFFGLMGQMFYAIFYLQGVHDLSPFASGLRLVPVAVGIAVGAVFSVRLVRLFGVRAVGTTGMLVIVGCLLGYALLQVDTPIWEFELLILVLGLGIGVVMAPMTESIMAALPRDRSGAGAAMNNALRQVGGVLGVAVLGSILSQSYTRDIGPSLTRLPEQVRTAAAQSAEATRAVAPHAPGIGLVDAANHSYVVAMHVTTAWAAGVAMLGAITVFLFFRRSRSKGRSH